MPVTATTWTDLNRTVQWFDVDEQLPDDGQTVLIHCAGADDPVWIGYHDGETWRDVDGANLGNAFVHHWAELPEPPTPPSA